MCIRDRDEDDAFRAAQLLAQATGTEIPPQIADLQEKPVLHPDVVGRTELKSAVEVFIERMGE